MAHSQYLFSKDFDGLNMDYALLDLPYSLSQIHGMMCAYICMNEPHKGLAFLQTLSFNIDDTKKRVFLQLHELFTDSQKKITQFDLEFSLFLPQEPALLQERAQALQEWCLGFVTIARPLEEEKAQYFSEETQEALDHLKTFSELDYQQEDIDDEDEMAFEELYEYTRISVLDIFTDLTHSQATKDVIH